MEQTKKLPTPNELMKKIGHESMSVSYCESRLILDNLDKPVLAYGIGLSAFVCIIESCRGVVKGYSYSGKGFLGAWQDFGWKVIDVETIIDTINNNEFIVEKGFARKDIKEIHKFKQTFQRPVLAEFKVKFKSSWNVLGNHFLFNTSYLPSCFKG